MMSEFERENVSDAAVVERRPPWLIDVFLYPVNASGLTMLGLFVLLPFVLDLISWVFNSLGLGIITSVLGLVSSIIVWVINFYMFWYLGFCIRESADGNFRAPDTLAPGFDDGFGETARQTFMILGVIAVCLLPSVAYYLVREGVDTNYWLILAGGGFFLPMALLSVIMFDGLWGLNPFRIIVSILRTFFRYFCVVCVFYVPLTIIAWFMINFYRNSNAVTYLLFRMVQVYLLFVASHILGRFYFNNEDRLRWFGA